MIIRHNQGASQFLAHIGRIEVPMPKSSLEGYLKEQLEFEASVNTELHKIKQSMATKLASRGVQLENLECRPMGVLPTVPPNCGLQLELWEYWLDALASKDGFWISADLVIGSLLSEKVTGNRSHFLILKNTLLAALRVSLSDFFADKGVETLLSNKQQWSRCVLDYIQQGHFERTISEFHSPLLGPGHQAGAVALWVTDIRIKPQPQAFRPAAKRYADPLTHLYFYSAVDPLANLNRQSREERRY